MIIKIMEVMVGLMLFAKYCDMLKKSSKLTILWFSMDMGKGFTSEFVGGAMGLLMTLGCLRLIWSMHLICHSIGYRHVSEVFLSMLGFFCLDGFIN